MTTRYQTALVRAAAKAARNAALANAEAAQVADLENAAFVANANGGFPGRSLTLGRAG